MHRNSFSFLIFAISLQSCTSVDGTGRYRIESIGNSYRSTRAEVVAVNPVYIADENAGSGVVLGADLGRNLAESASDDMTVILAGTVLGILVGEYIENQARVHNATEYTIRTGTGAQLRVAQANSGNRIFRLGDRVILIYGYPNRLLLDSKN